MVRIPKGILTCVTGVAGCGKSSLTHGCFAASHPEAIVIDKRHCPSVWNDIGFGNLHAPAADTDHSGVT
jgi:Excinuclease ATPase subunit